MPVTMLFNTIAVSFRKFPDETELRCFAYLDN